MSLSGVKIVLVEPSHPGNIGAVARAMKTMGLSRLCLVNPKKFPHYEASKRAAGGQDLLDAAERVDSLRDALRSCSLVLGTSVRDREVCWPTTSPRDAAAQVGRHLQAGRHLSASDHSGQVPVAIVFGRESSGLSNAELELCQGQIRIDANPEYSSLNLASAVQILSYELRMALVVDVALDNPKSEQVVGSDASSASAKRRLPATEAEREGHLNHLKTVLRELDFVKSDSPTVLFRKLRRLYSKAELTVEEIQILRGILTAIQRR